MCHVSSSSRAVESVNLPSNIRLAARVFSLTSCSWSNITHKKSGKVKKQITHFLVNTSFELTKTFKHLLEQIVKL